MTEPVAHDHLRAFVERIERMHEERRAIGDDIKEIYAEAKGNGFDTKALKIVIRKREQDVTERMELEAIVELYEIALGSRPDPRDEDNDAAHARAPARESASGVPNQFQPEADASDQPAGGLHEDHQVSQLISTNPARESGAVVQIDDDMAAGADTSLRADAIALGSDVEPVAPSNVTQLRPEKRITFNDKPHVDCLDPGQCGGFSNLGLCPRCKAVAGGGAAEIEHHGSVA